MDEAVSQAGNGDKVKRFRGGGLIGIGDCWMIHGETSFRDRYIKDM